MSVEGFEVPVHRALTQPVLIGGAPRDFAVFNITIGAIFLFSIGSPIGVPLSVTLHVVGVLLAKKDPYFLDVFRRHITIKPYYHA